MSKRQLYFVIVILLAIVLYLLFIPLSKPALAPATNETSSTTTSTTTPQSVPSTQSVTKTSSAATSTPTSVEGTFVGLDEAKTDNNKTFEYLLLDDGTEILRIDVRPLIGYSTIDVLSKLGIDRGEHIRITGYLNETQNFVPEKIIKL